MTSSEPRRPPAVVVEVLRVERGGVAVLDGLSLEVRAGAVTGLVGPSGGGKSTLLRSLVGVQRVAGGRVEVLGAPAGSPSLRRRVGYLTQAPSVYNDLSVREDLAYFARLHQVPPARIDELIEAVALGGFEERVVGRLSGGQRARVSLATALLGEPDILVLDEPTVGLDPQTRQTIWEHIHDLRKREGITVFMTTHYMDEAENCDRIGIMDHARLIALDTPAALKAGMGGDVVRLRTADNAAAARLLRDEYGRAPIEEDGALRFEVDRADQFVPILLRRFPVAVQSVEIARPTLNDVFLRLTGRAIREEGAGNERLRAAMRRRGGRGA